MAPLETREKEDIVKTLSNDARVFYHWVRAMSPEERDEVLKRRIIRSYATSLRGSDRSLKAWLGAASVWWG